MQQALQGHCVVMDEISMSGMVPVFLSGEGDIMGVSVSGMMSGMGVSSRLLIILASVTDMVSGMGTVSRHLSVFVPGFGIVSGMSYHQGVYSGRQYTRFWKQNAHGSHCC